MLENVSKIRVVKTVGGIRRIPESELRRLFGEEAKGIDEARDVRVVVYARVSSYNQEQHGDLDRQLGLLRKYAQKKGYRIVKEIKDRASGLKEDRKGLKRIFELAEKGLIDKVLVTYPDRLERFGLKYIEKHLSYCNVLVEYIKPREQKEPREELIEDLISVITSFAGKLYGLRSHKVKKLKETVERELKENGSD
ncbi:MAG: IS607 family transposase [Candidatus Baldrarchaeia archaeon]